MSSLVLDRQWIRDANLLRPGWKPVTPVVPDRSNELTEGLIAAWLFQGGDYHHQRDSVGRYHGTFAGTTDANIYMDETDKGIAFYNRSDNKNTRLDLGAITSADLLSGYSTQALSVYTIYRRIGTYTNTNPRFIDKSNGGTAANGWCFSLDSAPAVTLSINSSYSLLSRPADVAGVWYGLGCSAKGSGGNTNIRYFQDGAYFGNHTLANTFQATTTNAAISNWNHSTDRALNGHMLALMVWARALEDIEHGLIHADPFGMFISP